MSAFKHLLSSTRNGLYSKSLLGGTLMSNTVKCRCSWLEVMLWKVWTCDTSAR